MLVFLGFLYQPITGNCILGIQEIVANDNQEDIIANASFTVIIYSVDPVDIGYQSLHLGCLKVQARRLAFNAAHEAAHLLLGTILLDNFLMGIKEDRRQQLLYTTE